MTTTERINPAYLQPDTLVGPYRILDLVGHGGFGYLYRVQRDGKTYALKLSRERFGDLSLEDRAHNEERIDREIQALKSLRHPNIVRVHSFDRWPELETGYPYLIMDFVAGERLYNWRQQTTPSLRRMCEVLTKISLAVDYMHRLGLFHRDLKSENILVRSSDGEPILVDFGIARPKTSYTVTRAQNTLGTITHYSPEYAAYSTSPEFSRGLPFVWTAATDLHSLGYVAYELLTGRSPFPRANTEHEQLHAIKTVVPPLPSLRTNHRLPGSIDTVIMKLLEKAPEHRYQTGQELADGFRAALDTADASWDAPFDLPPPNDTDEPTAQPNARPRVTIVSPASLTAAAARAPAPASIPMITDEGQLGVASSPAAQSMPSPPPASPGLDGFSAPTGIRPHFTSIRPPAAEAPAEEPREAPILPTGIRDHAKNLAPAPTKTLNAPLLLGAGLVVLLLIVFGAIAVLGTKKPTENRSDLLAAVEQQQKLDAATPPPPTSLPPTVTPLSTAAPDVVVVPNPSPPPPTLPPVPVDAPPPPRSTRTVRSDARDIDAAVAREYGRPTVGGDTTKPAPPSDQPAWLRRSQRLDGSGGAKVASSTLGVPLGSHLPVKLLSNLDSRTISGAPIEAMVTTPFLVNGAVVIPARTVLYGQGSTAGDRFTIRFTHLRLPDNSVVNFQGLALDKADRKAGLVAARRIQGEAPTGPAVGDRIAKGTANTLLNTVQGGLGQDLARNAGAEVVNQGPGGPGSRGTPDAILLDAPVNFTVFVSAAF